MALKSSATVQTGSVTLSQAIHMLTEIFTSEAFWFWTMIIVQSALIVFFVEHGSPIGAGFSILTLLGGIAFFPGQWDFIGLASLRDDGLWSWLGNKGWMVLAGVSLYLLIGLGWGMLRWWMFVRHLREDYEQHKAKWLLPTSLDHSAAALRSRADYSSLPAERARLIQWAEACAHAAFLGGGRLDQELKPAWKDYVQNGYRH
jgi:hypothetical protein